MSDGDLTPEQHLAAARTAERITDAMRIAGTPTFGDLLDAACAAGARTLEAYIDGLLGVGKS